MQRARDQFFTGARFAMNQHWRHALGHFGDALFDHLHGRRDTDQRLKCTVF